MKTRKLTPKQIILAFVFCLSVFSTMACGDYAGDALGIACSVDPNNANCS